MGGHEDTGEKKVNGKRGRIAWDRERSSLDYEEAYCVNDTMS